MEIGFPAVLIRILENSTVSLFDIVGAFKSITTVKYVNGVKNNGWHPFDNKLWQFQYHDRIIAKFVHFVTGTSHQDINLQ